MILVPVLVVPPFFVVGKFVPEKQEK